MRSTKLLNATAALTRSNTETPASAAEARELLDALHDVDEALDELHRKIACVSPLDRNGRCLDCGRLVTSSDREHEKRGCALLIPVLGQLAWIKAHAHLIYSIPYAGKALFLARRSLATTSQAGGGDGARPLSVSSASDALRAAGTNTGTGE